jgi:hypothetical protein
MTFKLHRHIKARGNVVFVLPYPQPDVPDDLEHGEGQSKIRRPSVTDIVAFLPQDKVTIGKKYGLTDG